MKLRKVIKTDQHALTRLIVLKISFHFTCYMYCEDVLSFWTDNMSFSIKTAKILDNVQL